MTDEDKQKMTETLVIKAGVVTDGYLKAIDDEDERLINQAHQSAKENLEKLLVLSNKSSCSNDLFFVTL